jgi:hypothetical protein
VIPPLASLAADDYKSGLFEHVQVQHDGASVKVVEYLTQLTGRFGSSVNRVEDHPPIRVGDRPEDKVVGIVQNAISPRLTSAGRPRAPFPGAGFGWSA